jgi:hypothetical protein
MIYDKLYHNNTFDFLLDYQTTLQSIRDTLHDYF